MHPPWLVSKGMGEGGGATGGVAEHLTKGMQRVGGGTRSRREPEEDESRKEMTDRVARHQAH